MKRRTTYGLPVYALLVVVLVFTTSFHARTQETAPTFDFKAVMVEMRDGVKLNTHIFAPKGHSALAQPLPIILERTPYQASESPGWAQGKYKELAADGYIFVFQDIRGRFKSEGQFVMQRAPVSAAPENQGKNDPKIVDEVTDAYDTVEWLTKNVPNNNGRVGIIGISYPGWTAMMATINPHPALRAASPQASPADMWMGDDFHHNGAFRLSYGFEYATMMETNKEQARFEFDKYDTYEWYLKLGALSNVNEKYLHGKIPTWNDFVEHPNYDEFWQRQAAAGYLKQALVPTLNVAGWWDQEDFYGPIKIYETLEKNDPNKQNFFVGGPWNHGGWARAEGSNLGKIKFDSNASLHYRQKIEAPFFAFYLKDKGQPTWQEATVFETGSNQWKSYEQWPPRDKTEDRKLYFHAGGKLAFSVPGDATAGISKEAFDSYISDPANPVPYRPRPVEPTYYPRGSGWGAWLVEDQRFAQGRPDMLSWETETLTEDVTVSGNVIGNLFASTTGTDSDWIIKLIDVYPEEYAKEPKMGGYQLMVANEVFRGRFRKSFEKPEALTPNAINKFKVDMRHCNHRFLKGHKIMVQVQSTWFPVIDRNPQKFVPNIFKATDADYIKATQRVFRSKQSSSHVAVPVIVR
ncbi:MAG: CocE/NonD family hydrolase [Acidobacteriota bacterium]|nr:CocE/NonD family hydrolase [Acidobacteriota bacterium]